MLSLSTQARRIAVCAFAMPMLMIGRLSRHNNAFNMLAP